MNVAEVPSDDVVVATNWAGSVVGVGLVVWVVFGDVVVVPPDREWWVVEVESVCAALCDF